MKNINLFVLIVFTSIMTSCGSGKNENSTDNKDTVSLKPIIKEEQLVCKSDTANLNAFVVYNSNAKEKLPVILIVHEWWGLNDYTKNRAKQLADLGYFAVAMDMYGDGQTAGDPAAAQKLAMPFYQNPMEANKRIEATLEQVKSFKQADLNNVVAIGYCFGGSMVLNAAKSGLPFKGIVSFHGGLAGITPEKGKTKATVLVCHGAADKFVSPEEVAKFKMQMDSVGAKYTFIEYADATHAFTNPDATANGKKFNLPIAYNEKADKDSWEDFMAFLKKVFR